MCGIAGMVAREPVRGIGSATLRLARALRHGGAVGRGPGMTLPATAFARPTSSSGAHAEVIG